MTNPKKLKDQIDETLSPRFESYREVLARTQPSPLAIERADALYLWDQYRNQYLDFASFLHPVGHSNDAVRTRVAEQMAHYGYTAPQGEHVSRWPVEYARMLSESLERPEGPLQVLYCDSEETARELALRVAERVNLNSTAGIIRLLKDNGQPTRPIDVQNLADKIKKDGGVVIVDESKTGFGRLGTFWGQERYNIDADITVVGGPAGGGLPFGAVLAPAGYWELMAPLDVSQTAGNPIICAAGAQTMTEINVGVLEHVTDAATTLNESLDELTIQFPHVVYAHYGAGLLHTVEFQEPEIARQFRRSCLDKGLHLAPPKFNRIELTPALITAETEIRRGVDLMAGACLDFE